VRWKYAAHLRTWSRFDNCRGLAYYEAPGVIALPRLLMASADATLRAVDARTGAPCKTFGRGGSVDLLKA